MTVGLSVGLGRRRVAILMRLVHDDKRNVGDGFLQAVREQVGVNLCGHGTIVPHHFADSVEVNALHGQMARERVAKRMERAPVDVGSLQKLGKFD